MYRILTLLLCLACGNPGHEQRSTTTPTEALRERYSEYSTLILTQRDEHGFIYASDCDSLLFSSLTGSIIGPIDIGSAEQKPGKFVRLSNPDNIGKCNSDISRDMLTGLFLYLDRWEDQRTLLRIWDWGSSHNWKMGDGDDRTIMSPGLIGELASVLYHVSHGKVDYAERHIPQVYTPIPGYQTHLLMIQLLTEGRIAGEVSTRQLSALQKISLENSENPLAQALLHRFTDGDQSKATELLLSQFPGGRLPDTRDYCDMWRTQRADWDTGLRPCPDRGQIHSGGDFLVAAAVILGEI